MELICEQNGRVPGPQLTPDEISTVGDQYKAQDEFVYIEPAMPAEDMKMYIDEAERLSPLIHRNYVPLQKQGASISYRTLIAQESCFLKLYKSPALISMLEQVTGRRLLLCPESDSHACAVYYYAKKGDHIDWHYDSSFYKGERFTLLLCIKDTTNAESCHLAYQLYTRRQDRKVEHCAKKLAVGSLTLFNGDRLWHKVTPLTAEDGERIMLSMEFVTTQEIGLIGKCISDVKDAVSYFGVSALLPAGWTTTATKLLPAPGRKALENSNAARKPPKIICFVNPVSGAQRGSDLIPLLREVLGAENVYDLSVTSPLPGLIANIHEEDLRVVACGGDGTVRWVIQTMIDYNFLPLPPIGVLPMGTGNDLSREFGWGISYTPKRSEIASIVNRLEHASSRPLDIWQVHVTPWDPVTGQRGQTRTTSEVMFNYYNMGFNAQAAYGFHSMRRQSPEMFKSRFINKCWYFYYGLGSLVTGGQNLTEIMDVKVDGEQVKLPSDLRTLVLLNFTCYQAGLDIWGPEQPGDSRKPKMDDRMLEVVGLGGPTHEALVRLYLTSGMRIAQGRHVEIAIQKPGVSVAMAYDGEPCWQEPCLIDVKLWGQVDVLRSPETKS